MEELSTGLTRRTFITSTLSAAALATVLSGCGGLFGGSGDSGAVDFTGAKGNITLPPGLKFSDLEIAGSTEAGTLTATGYTITVQGGAPSLVTVMNTNLGKVALFGVADPTLSSNDIGPRSCAEAILFMALGGVSYSGRDRTTLLNAIKVSPATATLTTAIQTDMAANPYAISEPSAALLAAIKTAVGAFTYPAAAQSQRPATPRASSRALDPLLLIEPSNEVDGVTVVQTSNPAGFAAQNTLRRYGRMYTYTTAHVDDKGVETAESPVKRYGNIIDVLQTKTLLHLPNGWAQNTSATQPLAIQGTDAKTKYEMIHLAPVFGGFQSPIFNDSRYSAEFDSWNKELASLRQSVAISAAMEFILEALGLGGASLSYASVSAQIATILGNTTSLKTMLLDAAAGSVKLITTVTSALQSAVTADAVLTREATTLLPLIEQVSARKAAEFTAAQTATKAFVRLRIGLAALIVLGIVELADAVAVGIATSNGKDANMYAATVYQPKFTLSPSSATYTPGSKVILTATIPNKQGKTYTYHWKAANGTNFVFDDGKIFDKLEFDSANSVTTLTTSPSTLGDITVSVEAFDTTGGGKTSIGTASVTVKKGDGNTTVGYQVTTYHTPVATSGGTHVVTYYNLLSFPFKEGYSYQVLYTLDGSKTSYSLPAQTIQNKPLTSNPTDFDHTVVNPVPVPLQPFGATPFILLGGSVAALQLGWRGVTYYDPGSSPDPADVAKALADLDSFKSGSKVSIEIVETLG